MVHVTLELIEIYFCIDYMTLNCSCSKIIWNKASSLFVCQQILFVILKENLIIPNKWSNNILTISAPFLS